MEHVSELLTRAVADVVPRELALQKIAEKKKMRLYWGIDPTGAKIHLGHAVPLRKMRAFQDAGHHVILLIGSFTAMIGDPTGRDEMRKSLTAADVQKNFVTYVEQAKKILNMETLEVRYNHEWLESLSFKEILALTSHFTVQQLLQRDMFQERMKKDAPISLTEFMYPLMVGYDSVILDVDVELGGNDQLFNMLAGRTLQKAFRKRDKFVLTTKLLEGTDGRKMSKTYENCVYLTDSADEMYGKILSIRDHLIPGYMECCTDIPMTDVKAAEKALKDGTENPKNLKMRLAREIVTMYHSKEAAESAERNFQSIFQKGEIPDEMPEYTTSKGELVLDALVKSGTLSSKSEARRLIDQQGLKREDGTVITDVQASAQPGIYRVGKRKFLRITT